MKPLFLRNLAEWIEEWQLSQVSNSQKFTLSKQTSEALTTTLRCTASLIDDLIQEGYDYFLISRLLTDPLELRLSKYRQMSGGRFLIGLRELETSERILAVKTLLKESVNIWEEDVRKESCNISLMKLFDDKLQEILPDIEECNLDSESFEVATVISGYVVKKVNKKIKCGVCKTFLLAESGEVQCQYFEKLSRGGLILPAIDFTHVSKAFAILDTAIFLIRDSTLCDRYVAERVLRLNDCATSFLCDEHQVIGVKFINRVVTNIYFNNEQKQFSDEIRKNSVKDFKSRQRKKLKLN